MSMLSGGGCAGGPSVAAAGVVSFGPPVVGAGAEAGQPGAGMAAIRVNAAVIWAAHGQLVGMRSQRRRCPRVSRAAVCRTR
jgi:hypothetical protein